MLASVPPSVAALIGISTVLGHQNVRASGDNLHLRGVSKLSSAAVPPLSVYLIARTALSACVMQACASCWSIMFRAISSCFLAPLRRDDPAAIRSQDLALSAAAIVHE